MFTPQYIHLGPTSSPQSVSVSGPYAAVVIIDAAVSPDWRHTVSEWLVETGCLYMMAHGEDCSLWDDSVDWANIEAYNFKDIPDDKFVTTSWHDDESLEEVFYFAINCALRFSPLIKNIILLDITDMSREEEILKSYETVQEEVNTDDNEITNVHADKNNLFAFFGMTSSMIGAILGTLLIPFLIWIFLKYWP